MGFMILQREKVIGNGLYNVFSARLRAQGYANETRDRGLNTKGLIRLEVSYNTKLMLVDYFRRDKHPMGLST